jgi:hypothetical protein
VKAVSEKGRVVTGPKVWDAADAFWRLDGILDKTGWDLP